MVDTHSVHPFREPLDDTSFDRVLAGARAGEQWAIESLFVDLQPRLLRFLRATEPRAADDLAGEVWLAVARDLHTFEGTLAGFRSWFFTMARHRLIDHRRMQSRRATEPADHERLGDVVDAAGDHRADVADAVLADLNAQEALDLIRGVLPPEQAEVVLLRLVADLDVAQVAEVLGRDANWVRVNQHRALRKLQATLSENFFTEGVMPTTPGTV